MAVRFPTISRAVDLPEREVNYSFDHLTYCCKSGKGLGELWHPNGVAIDSDTNQIYIAEGAHYHDFPRVSIFTETGVFLKAFSHKNMKCAYGIAIHKGNVYVTDRIKHMVFHFEIKREFRLVAWLGGRGSRNKQFNDPRQLTVSTDGFIWVTDFGNNRIKILNGNLHYQRHISHHSMIRPCDVKLTPDEVFVLCQTSPSVKIFSYSGKLIRSLITHHQINLSLYPQYFCLDSCSNILHCDHGCHKIKILSKEGTLLHTLEEAGDQVGLIKYPRGITLTNNQKLIYVSTHINSSLQIYSSD